MSTASALNAIRRDRIPATVANVAVCVEVELQKQVLALLRAHRVSYLQATAASRRSPRDEGRDAASFLRSTAALNRATVRRPSGFSTRAVSVARCRRFTSRYPSSASAASCSSATTRSAIASPSERPSARDQATTAKLISVPASVAVDQSRAVSSPRCT